MLSKFSNFSGPISAYKSSGGVTNTISLLLYLDSSFTQSSDLIVNGNFSDGDTGFTSDYTLGTIYDFGNDRYAVATHPNNFNGAWENIGDHTTGSGNMLIVNGSTTLNKNFWCQNVSVETDKNYLFTFWAASLYVANYPTIEVIINDTSCGTYVPDSPQGTWTEFKFVWNSGSNATASICLRDLNTTGIGNDFVIDDISFHTTNLANNVWYDNTLNHRNFTFSSTAIIKNYWGRYYLF